jgi:hypothetical protein
MEIRIMKNMEPAPYMGSRFGQDVEAKGTYVLEKDHDYPLSQNWVEGRAEIKNPLIIPVNDENLIKYKYDLAAKYKAKGKRLTEKLMALGYDAIVTKYDKGYTGEIVLFPNCNFMLNINETKTLIKNLLRENLFQEDKHKNLSLIAFHGSLTDFKNFSDEFVGGKDATDQNGPGIYFTSSENEAYSYAGEKGKLYKVELNPRIIYDDKPNKFTITPAIVKKLVLMADEWEDNAANYDYPASKGLNSFITSTFNYNDNDKDVLLQVWINFYRYEGVKFVRNCVALGIDGIMVTDEIRGTTHYIIYNPNIVKLLEVK